MDTTLTSPEYLKKVFSGQQRHPNYASNVQMAEELLIHTDGKYPAKLIDERRPNEPEAVKKYRKEIYKAITKRPVGKVITALGKIRRSSDWVIRYDDDLPPIIKEDETPESYLERKYPVYSSLTNWMFSEVLKQYLMDANAVIAVKPLSYPVVSSEYLQPVAEVFTSDRVLDWREGEFAILLSSETVRVSSPQGQVIRDGKVWYVYTPDRLYRYEEVNSAGTIDLRYELPMSEFAPFKTKGQFLKKLNNETIFESRIAVMLPELDEAAREYSDLQAGVVQHLYMEKYAYTNTECPSCQGGKNIGSDGKPETCTRCGGSGNIAELSPYGFYQVNATMAGEQQLPAPPIGYVQKDLGIIELEDKRVDAHVYKSLAAVNMEFLADVPLSQSGVAKEVDRDELNTFVNLIAEDIVSILDNTYNRIINMRYGVVVPSEVERKKLPPKVNVPERFDILSANFLLEEIEHAKTAGVNPVIMRAMQVEFAGKKFATQPEVAHHLTQVYDLDPLPGISDEDKSLRLMNGGITERDYILSSNIEQFIRRAAEENKGFYDFDLKKKRDILYAYADETLTANSAKAAAEQAAKLPIPTDPKQLDE